MVYVGKYEGAGICTVRTRSRPKQEQEHHGHSAVFKSHVAEGCHDLLKWGVRAVTILIQL
jgi:hypothetical protein